MKKTNFERYLVTILAMLIGILALFLYKRLKVQPKIDISQSLNKDNVMPVVILGSGPAGQAAGIYASRLGFKTLIVSGSKPGGQLTETSFVENWPGERKILGRELMKKLQDHNLGLDVSFLEDTVTKVNFSKWPFELETADGVKLNALSVIITTGSSPLTLKVPGESEYWGKGVTTCAICDAPFYKGKNVVVVGGGDSAAEQVLQLSPHVAHITMLVRKDSLRASQAMQDRVKEVKNLTIVYNSQLKQIIGNSNHVVSVDILNNKDNSIKNQPIDGVFLAIGHSPNTSLFKKQIDMDSAGYIEVKGRSQQTSIPGVFAAGDVEDHVYMQAGIASGAGIKAALDASAFLHKIGFTNEIAKKLENKYYEVSSSGLSNVVVIKSQRELDKITSSNKIPVIVDFWAHHCPSCIHMLPSFESVAKKFANKAVFVKVDIEEAQDIVKKLFILKVPSFIVFKDGQIVARFNDFMDKSQMIDFVNKFI